MRVHKQIVSMAHEVKTVITFVGDVKLKCKNIGYHLLIVY